MQCCCISLRDMCLAPPLPPTWGREAGYFWGSFFSRLIKKSDQCHKIIGFILSYNSFSCYGYLAKTPNIFKTMVATICGREWRKEIQESWCWGRLEKYPCWGLISWGEGVLYPSVNHATYLASRFIYIYIYVCVYINLSKLTIIWTWIHCIVTFWKTMKFLT